MVVIVLFMCIAGAAVFPYGATVVASDTRYAAELSRMPVGCRITAMGEAGVAMPFDATGIFWNPASPSFTSSKEAVVEYASLYGGMSSKACGAFRAPLQQALSVGILYEPFFSGDIEVWDELQGTPQQRLMDPSKRADGSNEGVFTNTHHILSVSLAKLFKIPFPRPSSYSYPLPIELSVGLSFKGYWQTMNPRHKLRMGMNANCDAGVLFHLGIDYDLTKKMVSREIFAGISVKDALKTKVVWLHSPVDYQETVDRSEYIGCSYRDKTGILGAQWTITIAGSRFYAKAFHGGIEARYWNIVAFRAGVSDKVPTLGAGVQYKNISLDYAFTFDELAYCPLWISLGYVF